MRVEKVVNNNIILSRDDSENEVIVMGRGLGFGVKAGQMIEESKIEKIFKLETMDKMEQFKELLKNLPVEHIQTSHEIISYAKEALGKELNENVYLTLTDHISFAIDRFKEGMLFGNALCEEIKLFYPNEYTVGCHALYLIEKNTGIKLLEDEAASIAIHIVNAEFNSVISTTFTLTQMIKDMLEIIEKEISIDADQKNKLAINFKYLVHRMLTELPEDQNGDEVFFDFVKEHCKKEYHLILQVNNFIKEKYNCHMTEEESIYLALNVKRINDVQAR